MGPKILLLSWRVPPDLTGASIVVMNLAQQFTRDKMIVAGEKPFGKTAFRWRPEWPEIVYVQSMWPVTNRGLRWWRMIQFPRLVWNCLRLVRRHKVGTMVVVLPSAQFLFAGYLVARWTGCRFYPYFHNTYYECRQGLERRFAAWLQKRVFASAEHVFVMSEGMSELYQERYPGVAQTPLLHTFNEALPAAEMRPLGSPLRFAFAGNVNQSCEDAMVRLAGAVLECPGARLSIISGTPRRHLENLGLLGERTSHETVPRDAMLRRLAEADVVLLPHGLTGPDSREEYLTIFPTKTIECLICGRPILAHCTAGSFLARFLRENDCALVVDEPDVAALREAITKLRTDADLRLRLVRNALKTAERFQASRVAEELRARLAVPRAALRGEETIPTGEVDPFQS